MVAVFKLHTDFLESTSNHALLYDLCFKRQNAQIFLDCRAVLYDPKTGRIAGLEPCHFITIATPHMGCDAEGITQV